MKAFFICVDIIKILSKFVKNGPKTWKKDALFNDLRLKYFYDQYQKTNILRNKISKFVFRFIMKYTTDL